MPGIPARELREHLSARRQSNHLTLVVNQPRSAVQRLATETHWGTVDQLMYRGQQQTACGAYVDLARFSADPTCAAYRQQQAIHESLQF